MPQRYIRKTQSNGIGSYRDSEDAVDCLTMATTDDFRATSRSVDTISSSDIWAPTLVLAEMRLKSIAALGGQFIVWFFAMFLLIAGMQEYGCQLGGFPTGHQQRLMEVFHWETVGLKDTERMFLRFCLTTQIAIVLMFVMFSTMCWVGVLVNISLILTLIAPHCPLVSLSYCQTITGGTTLFAGALMGQFGESTATEALRVFLLMPVIFPFILFAFLHIRALLLSHLRTSSLIPIEGDIARQTTDIAARMGISNVFCVIDKHSNRISPYAVVRGVRPKRMIIFTERGRAFMAKHPENAKAILAHEVAHLERECLARFRDGVGPQLYDRVARYADHHYTLLFLGQHVQEFGDLLVSNPGLAYSLACRYGAALKERADEVLRGLQTTLRFRQTKLMETCGFDSKLWRVLSRIPPAALNERRVAAIKRTANNRTLFKLIQHIDFYTPTLLDLLSYEGILGLVTPRFLMELARPEDGCPDDSEIPACLFRLVRALSRFAPNRLVIFRNVGDFWLLYDQHRDVIEGDWYETLLTSHFPSPPFQIRSNGDAIEPIDTPQKLLAEATAMRSCVVSKSYVRGILSGKTFFFRVLPRYGLTRATLMLTNAGGGDLLPDLWVVADVKGVCNASVPKRTLDALITWLSQAQNLPEGVVAPSPSWFQERFSDPDDEDRMLWSATRRTFTPAFTSY